jgi:predicted RNase H-like nuclease
LAFPYSKDCIEMSSPDLLHQYYDLEEKVRIVNNRFSKEQKQLQLTMIYEIKQYFQKHYEELCFKKNEGTQEKELKKFHLFLNDLRKKLVDELLFRQSSELKALQGQLTIYYSEHDDSLGFPQNISSSIQFFSNKPNYVFEPLFALTEQFVSNELISR